MTWPGQEAGELLPQGTPESPDRAWCSRGGGQVGCGLPLSSLGVLAAPRLMFTQQPHHPQSRPPQPSLLSSGPEVRQR